MSTAYLSPTLHCIMLPSAVVPPFMLLSIALPFTLVFAVLLSVAPPSMMPLFVPVPVALISVLLPFVFALLWCRRSCCSSRCCCSRCGRAAAVRAAVRGRKERRKKKKEKFNMISIDEQLCCLLSSRLCSLLSVCLLCACSYRRLCRCCSSVALVLAAPMALWPPPLVPSWSRIWWVQGQGGVTLYLGEVIMVVALWLGEVIVVVTLPGEVIVVVASWLWW